MPNYPATYFWKQEGSDTVHWHYLCDRVPVRVKEHPRWRQADAPPPGKSECPDCAMRDRLVTIH